MTRVRIENETHWRTDHLAAIVREVVRRTADDDDRIPVVARFNYSRRGSISGHAYTEPVFLKHKLVRLIRLHMPSATRGDPWTVDQNKRALAEVIEHELLHTHGQEHTRERGHYTMSRHGLAPERYAWVDTMPIERAPKPVKLPVDYDARRAAKLAHAEAKLVEWERKATTAARKMRQWRRRIADLQRQQAVAAKRP